MVQSTDQSYGYKSQNHIQSSINYYLTNAVTVFSSLMVRKDLYSWKLHTSNSPSNTKFRYAQQVLQVYNTLIIMTMLENGKCFKYSSVFLNISICP